MRSNRLWMCERALFCVCICPFYRCHLRLFIRIHYETLAKLCTQKSFYLFVWRLSLLLWNAARFRYLLSLSFCICVCGVFCFCDIFHSYRHCFAVYVVYCVFMFEFSFITYTDACKNCINWYALHGVALVNAYTHIYLYIWKHMYKFIRMTVFSIAKKESSMSVVCSV